MREYYKVMEFGKQVKRLSVSIKLSLPEVTCTKSAFTLRSWFGIHEFGAFIAKHSPSTLLSSWYFEKLKKVHRYFPPSCFIEFVVLFPVCFVCVLTSQSFSNYPNCSLFRQSKWNEGISAFGKLTEHCVHSFLFLLFTTFMLFVVLQIIFSIVT